MSSIPGGGHIAVDTEQREAVLWKSPRKLPRSLGPFNEITPPENGGTSGFPWPPRADTSGPENLRLTESVVRLRDDRNLLLSTEARTYQSVSGRPVRTSASVKDRAETVSAEAPANESTGSS
ncbi:hypothetical protein [Streptomyces rimosus]|uniref:hypothetical protein n=1 Tax=Streptomyces rimosus TaxID=1927 RepID=UPI0037AC0A74